MEGAPNCCYPFLFTEGGGKERDGGCKSEAGNLEGISSRTVISNRDFCEAHDKGLL